MIQLQDNGWLSVRYYTDEMCTSSLNGSARFTQYIDVEDTDIRSDALNSSSRNESGYRWTYYESTSTITVVTDNSTSDSSFSSPNSTTDAPSITTSSSTKTPEIVGLVGGLAAVVVIILSFVVYRGRKKGKHSRDFDQQRTSSLSAEGTPVESVLGQSGLWNDDVITAKRISRRAVQIDKLISRGAYGEVYDGTFDGTRVAVKRLPPETRGSIHHVNNFLAEAKLTASMDHPRIIHVLGVAWNSLSDLCVVMELSNYEKNDHPVGIDREKATIALHVCHALTYLHSLSPPVIHRDLKSRNILLNHSLEAKVTDSAFLVKVLTKR